MSEIGIVISKKEEMAKMMVQEIAKRGDEVPEKYLYKDGFPEAIDNPDLWMDSLLIDFSLLSSVTPAAEDELAKLRSAFSSWGCFQVINHGIESSFLEELIELSKQFFALPLEEKLKCTAGDDMLSGYGNDFFHDMTQVANWTDRLALVLYPEENRKLQVWPHKPEKFRDMLDEYSKKLPSLIEGIYKAMARSLNLEEHCFVNNQGKQGTIAAKLHIYPRCPCPERVLGVRPHSDGSTITINLGDKQIDGLQIQKDDQWYKVPCIPGALLIVVGDLGEAMTNGIFKIGVHRVVTNSLQDRVSLVAFSTPEDKNGISPVSELITADQPQLYKNLDLHEYRKIYFERYAQGRMTIDALKL